MKDEEVDVSIFSFALDDFKAMKMTPSFSQNPFKPLNLIHDPPSMPEKKPDGGALVGSILVLPKCEKSGLNKRENVVTDNCDLMMWAPNSLQSTIFYITRNVKRQRKKTKRHLAVTQIRNAFYIMELIAPCHLAFLVPLPLAMQKRLISTPSISESNLRSNALRTPTDSSLLTLNGEEISSWFLKE